MILYCNKMSIRCGQRFQFTASSSLWQQQHIISTSTSFTIANELHRYLSNERCTSKRFMSDSSNPSNNILRPIKVALPKFGQNGTLVLRNDTSNNISNLQIIPQWRDDAMIELLPSDCTSTADAENNNRASSGVDEEEKIVAFEGTSKDSTTQIQKYGPMQFTNHTEGIVTSLGRKGSLIEVDILDTDPSSSFSSNGNISKQKMQLIATIPEKSNLTCQLNSGYININGKLEGDTHLSTNGGNITVSKLRGHHVSLETTSGIIHVKKAIEAKSVHITTCNRVRAQMINGSNVTINVKRPSTSNSSDDAKKKTAAESGFAKLDQDDEGALIDVGSLYISSSGGGESSNEAHLLVEDHNNGRGSDEGLVRVKSCHGHVTVHATKKTGTTKEDKQQLTHQKNQSSPLVDIGGVNGSCDITLEASSNDDTTVNTTNNNNNTVVTGTRVHFDAMTPESISTITSRGNNYHSSITMDRKLESEVRMLSAKSALPIEFNAYSLTSDDVEDIQSTLKSVSDAVVSKQCPLPLDNSMGRAISIETDAFKEDDQQQQETPPYEGIEYTHGTMSNRSGEPDSRFDVRTQSSSRGKINIDGAASQALYSFKKQSSSSSDNNERLDSSSLPLLAVATDSTIKLETLSWFGSIARRYGMDEEKNDRNVGRQASRKPRLG